jgi:hypothetical protein
VRIIRKDREILRDLAKQVAEEAARPVHVQRIALWKRHNSLQPCRPLILVFPEGSWRELLPEASLVCSTKAARAMELELKKRLFYRDHLRDDTVIEGVWWVPKAIGTSARTTPPARGRLSRSSKNPRT